MTDLDRMLDSYIECALWSSLHYASEDADPTPMDADYSRSDLAPETIEEMRTDCAAFLAANAHDIAATNATPEQTGHDFWLTRNRHGAGFWDRGYGPEGGRLTDAAHAYSGVDLYVGDDGRIYA